MDTNTVIEGTVKFRDGKKWKSRWCVVRKLSPVADCVHLQLYRDSKERYKQGQTKASLSLENFLGIQSGFTLDKESNTLAIICEELVVVLAFDTREHLMQWQVKISANLGEGDQFLVQISSAPSRAKLSPGPARLLIQEFQFCLTVGVPPRLIAFWQIRQLRRFGVVEGKFCFEGGSHCGRGEGLYVLVTEKPEELAKSFHLAADGKLFTRKRTLTRNMSVMEKARKHHTFRPESRLSDVSSMESVLESPHGCEIARNHCCGCSQSREDLLFWPQSPSIDRGDAVSTSDSLRYDLKFLWNADAAMGRCKSCMGKIGSMSRSSTLTATPCSRFPVWTMDRPKSCGSQKMSPSVTCSSVSLSSHSSKGSSCGNTEHHHRSSPVDNCGSRCSSNNNSRSSTGANNQTPPSRPPKPPHLSFLRLQSPPSELPSSPSSLMSPIKSPSCCCNHQIPTVNSPYDNYDVPKSLNVIKQNLKLDLRETSFYLRPQSQSSSEEYYDTPRRLKDSLIWEYGNYDIPPPAQPVAPSPAQLNNQQDSGLSKSNTKMGNSKNSSELDSFSNKESSSREQPTFHINKVKLTGEGKMPVMSPCGKIIENPEPTYEEKLECLLENEKCLADSSCNYENIEPNNKSDLQLERLSKNEEIDNSCNDTNQNYSNITLVQSLENYENFKPCFSEQCKSDTNNEFNNSHENIANEKLNKDTNSFNSIYNCCSNCGHVCAKLHNSRESILKQQNIGNCQFESNKGNSAVMKQGMTSDVNVISSSLLGAKCNSTSCLHEIKLDSNCSQEQSDLVKSNSRGRPFLHCSVSASNSPSLKRLTRQSTMEQSITSEMEHVRLRQRSNSADSSRIRLEEESVNDILLADLQRRTNTLSTPSSTSSMYVMENHENITESNIKSDRDVNKSGVKLIPLIISEMSDHREQLSQNVSVKYSDLIGAKRSSSVPNKFFSNRDSSSSNDSGVSTGSLSLRHCGTDFLEFEMPLTTSKSSKRHHIVMMNNATSINGSEATHKMLQKRSKSVDPLRSLTFTFGSEDYQAGKSTSAEAEIPIFLQENRTKECVNSQSRAFLSDSRSTSSGTSDMSDYFETLSFSSFSSLDAATDNFRHSRTSASTMKPRAGKEYHKINRNLLDQETKKKLVRGCFSTQSNPLMCVPALMSFLLSESFSSLQ